MPGMAPRCHTRENTIDEKRVRGEHTEESLHYPPREHSEHSVNALDLIRQAGWHVASSIN